MSTSTTGSGTAVVVVGGGGQRNHPASSNLPPIDRQHDKYPFCIVWTPIPVLTWFFPLVGHMGIALSTGVIRDFAGPYFVSEDNMAFGRPARYLRLDPQKCRWRRQRQQHTAASDAGGGSSPGSSSGEDSTTASAAAVSSAADAARHWDECVSRASVVYGTRMHNLFCDNCHSHVAMALELAAYDGRGVGTGHWHMVRLALWMFVCGRYVGVWGAVRTWLPFAVIVALCCLAGVYL